MLLLLIGMLGLSALGSSLFTLIEFPVYLPEVFFLPLLFYGETELTKVKLTYGQAYILLFTMAGLLCGIINTSDFFNVITCARPIVYLMLIVIWISSDFNRTFDMNALYLLCVGSQMGEIVNKLLRYSSISMVDHINWITLSAMILIPCIQNKKNKLVFSVLFGMLSAVLSLYRRILLFYIITILIALAYYVIQSKSYKKTIYIFLFVGMIICLFRYYEPMLLFVGRLIGLDEGFLRFRLINKMQTLFRGETTLSDAHRYQLYSELITTFKQKLIMPGPVGKSMDIVHYFGKYTDVPMVFLYDMYGSILSWIIVLSIGIRAGKCACRVFFQKQTDEHYILAGLFAPLFLLSLATDGAFLVHFPYAVSAGYIMSGWFRPRTEIPLIPCGLRPQNS